MKRLRDIAGVNKLKAAAAVLLAVAGGISSGCATAPPLVLAPPDAEVQFGVYAQIIVQVPGRGKQKFLAVWRRVEVAGVMQDEVEVKNPFGNTEAMLVLYPDEAVLQAGRVQVRAEDGSALAVQLFGAPLPVSAFHHWINARAAPGDATVARNTRGMVGGIRQFGWHINYTYDDAAPPRPQVIDIVNPALSTQVEVRIRRWL